MRMTSAWLGRIILRSEDAPLGRNGSAAGTFAVLFPVPPLVLWVKVLFSLVH
jgi:hypothetical protein